MDAGLFAYGFCALVVVGLYLWTFTKSGKEWLSNL